MWINSINITKKKRDKNRVHNLSTLLFSIDSIFKTKKQLSFSFHNFFFSIYFYLKWLLPFCYKIKKKRRKRNKKSVLVSFFFFWWINSINITKKERDKNRVHNLSTLLFSIDSNLFNKKMTNYLLHFITYFFSIYFYLKLWTKEK